MKYNFSIGNVFIKGNTVLAPMAGITDLPFRILAKRGGAGLVCSEMMSAKALMLNSKRTEKMLKIHNNEHPISMQIFGNDPESMRIAAKKVEQTGADIVDINLGCPVPKVKKSGSGCALTGDTEKWLTVLRAVIKAVTIPVTIKIRTGLTQDINTAPHICKISEHEGVSAVAIHARPASQHHTGPVFWDQVKMAAEAVTMPVIINGGIDDGYSAMMAMNLTGSKAIMLGRPAIGDFDVFKRIQHFLEKDTTIDPPDITMKMDLLQEHLKCNCDYYGEELGIKRLRKIIPYYIKELPSASSLRNELMKITKLSDMEHFINTIRKDI